MLKSRGVTFIFLAILLIGFLWLVSIISFINLEYGNHLILENPLEWPIDSVKIQVCKYECTFTTETPNSSDPNDTSLSGNIDPKGDKDGCAVIFTVYTPERTYLLPADVPFECSDCDYNHHYILTDSIAIYVNAPNSYWQEDSLAIPAT